MKFKLLTIILLSLFVRTNIHAAAASQEETGKKLIHEILHGDSASVSEYFENDVKASLTHENLAGIQSQVNWLSKLIGDTLEQFMSGLQPADSLGRTKVFFREYRLANESNKRSPLILMHLWFQDSTTNRAAGIFIKTFMDNSEKRIANEQTWEIDGKRVDINAIVMVTTETGSLMAIEVFDDDTKALDSTLVLSKGVPIIRKAIAEGFLEKTKQQAPGGVLMEDIGVAFLLKDPEFGFVKLKFGIKAKDYETTPGAAKKSNVTGKAAGPKKVRHAP